MFENQITSLTQKSMSDRLKDTAFLLKNSFSLVRQNTGIARPAVHLSILSVVMSTLFVGALVTFFLGTHIKWGIIALLVLVLILFPLRFPYRTFQFAIQSWMTYKAVTGASVTYSEARRHTGANVPQLSFIAFVDLIMAYVGSQRGQDQGIQGFFVNLFLSALVEIWDLLSHYMIPAVVIEQRPLKQLVPDIKSLQSNVPAALMGVFGIDFAGNVVRTLLFPAYLLVIGASVGLSYLLGSSLPRTSFLINGHLYCWVPVLLALYFLLVSGGILKATLASVKTIYFTIFYTSIAHPDEIAPALRAELTHYLLMEPAPASAPEVPGSPSPA